MLNDKRKLAALRKDIDAALAAVGAKHGVTVKMGNRITYAPDGLTASSKLEMVAGMSGAGPVLTKEEIEFDRSAKMYGIAAPRGTSFNHAGTTYILHGLKPRNSKYPVIARNASTKRLHKFPGYVVTHALKA